MGAGACRARFSRGGDWVSCPADHSSHMLRLSLAIVGTKRPLRDLLRQRQDKVFDGAALSSLVRMLVQLQPELARLSVYEAKQSNHRQGSRTI